MKGCPRVPFLSDKLDAVTEWYSGCICFFTFLTLPLLDNLVGNNEAGSRS